MPPTTPVSRRTFIERGSALPLGFALPSSVAALLTAALPEASAAGAAPSEPVRRVTKELVPDPEIVSFVVHYPGKEPVRLVGHMWYHAGAVGRQQRCPAILEVHPYRRRDGTMSLDSRMFPSFAASEYLCFRVDLHGSGDSGGVMSDEYSDEELAYCTQLIAQIASHPYCDGHVGMIGKSWSAINTLMVTAREDCPKALKAVVLASGSDDRYADDVHYMGGAMLYDNASWPTFMWHWLALPPDPQVVGPQWREMWRERVEQADFWFKHWASHQSRDAYWSRTSAKDHYERIKVPVFVTSGWQDAYKNQVTRLVSALTAHGVPVRGVLGPWGHEYPFQGYPGPQLDHWLQHIVTHWWDPYLKGKAPPPSAAGVAPWPQLLAWLGASAEPDPSPCAHAPGRWVAEDAHWLQRSEPLVFPLGKPHGLSSETAAAVYHFPVAVIADEAMLQTGSLGACGNDDLPDDQSAADGQALVFDSEPLAADLDCFGVPSVTLTLSATTPRAALALRLCEVSPTTGQSHLVTYRFFNLCHRGGDPAQPQLLTPGELVTLTIPLSMIGHTFKKGWRLRLALSTTLFPTLWPTAVAAGLSLHVAPDSGLHLLRRREQPGDSQMANLLATQPPAPEVNPEDYVPTLAVARPPSFESSIEDGFTATKSSDFGRMQLGGPLGQLWVDHQTDEVFEVDPEDPRTMTASSKATSILERSSEGWRVKTVTNTKIWSAVLDSGQEVFRYHAQIQTYLANEQGEDEAFAAREVSGEILRQWV